MRLGNLKEGDEFRMWDRGPLLHVIETKGENVIVQRGNVEMTKQELLSDTRVVVESERDLDGDPNEQLNAALKKSPFEDLQDMRVVSPPRKP